MFVCSNISGVCLSVSSPSSGILEVLSNGTHTIAIFTCDVGYELLGSSTTTCLSDGTWDDAEPICGI